MYTPSSTEYRGRFNCKKNDQRPTRLWTIFVLALRLRMISRVAPISKRNFRGCGRITSSVSSGFRREKGTCLFPVFARLRKSLDLRKSLEILGCEIILDRLREFPNYSVAPNQEGKRSNRTPFRKEKKKSERRRAGHGSKRMATECATFAEVTPTSNSIESLRTPDGARANAVVLI